MAIGCWKKSDSLTHNLNAKFSNRMGPGLQVAAAGRPGSRRAWRCVRRPAVAGGGAWRPGGKIFFFFEFSIQKLNLQNSYAPKRPTTDVEF